MVVYAGASGMALPPTSGDNKERIQEAINKLEAGGSTAGSEGIKLAYQKAQEHFMEDGNNRVILATDGDFNVGVTSDEALVRLIEEKREQGVFLSVLGYGKGNYQGSKMEKLSNKGNGNYSYIDNILEAKKTLVSEFGATMQTIAKDVKIQLEFNPAHVKAYRLIGYVNRQLDKEDFNNDSVDAGEIGAGHTVTALYEVVPKGVALKHKPGPVDSLRYQDQSAQRTSNNLQELGLVKFRYKAPDAVQSQKITEPVDTTAVDEPSEHFHWSAAVAMFGMELRDSKYKGTTDFDLIRSLAQKGLGPDEKGYRQGFLQVLDKAETLDSTQTEK